MLALTPCCSSVCSLPGRVRSLPGRRPGLPNTLVLFEVFQRCWPEDAISIIVRRSEEVITRNVQLALNKILDKVYLLCRGWCRATLGSAFGRFTSSGLSAISGRRGSSQRGILFVKGHPCSFRFVSLAKVRDNALDALMRRLYRSFLIKDGPLLVSSLLVVLPPYG